MASQCYLMSVSEFWDGIRGERLFRAALEKVDDERRKKIERMKEGKPQAACVGAGLLLQLAVQEALGIAGGTDVGATVDGVTDAGATVDGVTDTGAIVDGATVDGGSDAAETVECDLADFASEAKEQSLRLVEATCADRASGVKRLRIYSALQVMELVKKPVELVLDYGEKGKPYLREYPLFFNLSHSGEYVVCAVSDREIGVDIQICSGTNVMQIAKRFFSEEECRSLEACRTGEEKRQSFFRLWVRKEAYGKLLGKGILGVVSVNLLPGESSMEIEKELLWREWSFLEGYRIAMCLWA